MAPFSGSEVAHCLSYLDRINMRIVDSGSDLPELINDYFTRALLLLKMMMREEVKVTAVKRCLTNSDEENNQTDDDDEQG